MDDEERKELKQYYGVRIQQELAGQRHKFREALKHILQEARLSIRSGNLDMALSRVQEAETFLRNL